MKICAIVATDEARVIGAKGGIPWRLPVDMKRFAALTTGHTVLMGRKTFESLPEKFKPLPGRKNLVISRSSVSFPEVEVWRDPVECIAFYKAHPERLPSDTLWIIGGEQIYRSTMTLWDELNLTRVDGTHDGDAFFPECEDAFALAHEERSNGCSFLTYIRR